MRKEANLTIEKEIVKLIGVMAAAFPNTQVSSATIKVYTSQFTDIPLDVFTAAISQAIAESEFFPTVRAIREQAFRLTARLATQPTAGEAWGIVMREIQKIGFYRSPHFADPIIEQTVRYMGWRELCSSENQIADRAHFQKIYENLVARKIADAKLTTAARSLREFYASHDLHSGNPDDRLLTEDGHIN